MSTSDGPGPLSGSGPQGSPGPDTGRAADIGELVRSWQAASRRVEGHSGSGGVSPQSQQESGRRRPVVLLVILPVIALVMAAVSIVLLSRPDVQTRSAMPDATAPIPVPSPAGGTAEGTSTAMSWRERLERVDAARLAAWQGDAAGLDEALVPGSPAWLHEEQVREELRLSGYSPQGWTVSIESVALLRSGDDSAVTEVVDRRSAYTLRHRDGGVLRVPAAGRQVWRVRWESDAAGRWRVAKVDPG